MSPKVTGELLLESIKIHQSHPVIVDYLLSSVFWWYLPTTSYKQILS